MARSFIAGVDVIRAAPLGTRAINHGWFPTLSRSRESMVSALLHREKVITHRTCRGV
jgi:hypothetical protein